MNITVINQRKMDTKSWKEIKNEVYGKKGIPMRDSLEREFEGIKIGLLLKRAREEKKLTQRQLGEIIEKKRTYTTGVT